MSISPLKDQILAKLQEFDSALQLVINIRTELAAMLLNMSSDFSLPEIGIPLTFYDAGNVVVWEEKSKRLTPLTFRLLQHLWLAPDHTLSKGEMRHDVLEDGDAADGTLWTNISRAREELLITGIPYEIETVRGKGYRLITKRRNEH